MHPDDGKLQAYHDQALAGPDLERLRQHLAACPSCQRRLAALQQRTARVSAHLAALAPQPGELPPPARLAHARLIARYPAVTAAPKFNRFSLFKESLMFQKLTSRSFRPVLIALAVLVLVGGALAIPQVRAAAVSFLGLFRVQQVAIVPFDPLNLPQNMEEVGPRIEEMLASDVVTEQFGEEQPVATADEASALAGFPVRLPTRAPAGLQLSVQPAGRMTFQVDLPLIRSLLAEMDRGDISLPDALDNATITADLPHSVSAVFGNCDDTNLPPGADPDDLDNQIPSCVVLLQLPSPTVTAPEGLDVAQLGQAFLQFTGMSAADAASFSQNVDWTTTLVIPVPSSVEYHDVQVDGVTGSQVDGDYGQYIIIWVKQGILYALSGWHDTFNPLIIANSLP